MIKVFNRIWVNLTLSILHYIKFFNKFKHVFSLNLIVLILLSLYFFFFFKKRSLFSNFDFLYLQTELKEANKVNQSKQTELSNQSLPQDGRD